MAAKKKTQDSTEENTSAEPAEKPSRVEAAAVMEVDLSEEEGDDDGDDEEEKKLSRREKKQARGSLREEAEKLRERAMLAEQQAAYATGAAQAMAQRMQQPTEQRDPLDQHQEGVQREQKLLVQEYQQRVKRGELTPEEHDDFERRGNAIQAKLAENAARRVLREQQSQQPQQGQNLMAALQARYPDVMSNPNAFRRVLAKHHIATTDPTNPVVDDWNLADRLMQEVRVEFGMAPKSNGNERASGNSRRYEGGGAGASGSVKGEAQQKVTLTKDDVAAADAAYPYLPEKERYVRYARVTSRKTA